MRFLWVDDPFKDESKLQMLRFTKWSWCLPPSLLSSQEPCRHKGLIEKILKSMWMDDISGTSMERKHMQCTQSPSNCSTRLDLRKFASSSREPSAKVMQGEITSQTTSATEEETFTHSQPIEVLSV